MGRVPGGVVVVAVLAIVHGLVSLALALLFTVGGLGWLAGLLGTGTVRSWGASMVAGGQTSVVTSRQTVRVGQRLPGRRPRRGGEIAELRRQRTREGGEDAIRR